MMDEGGTMIRTSLNTLHLDSSDFCITRVGFGAWAIDAATLVLSRANLGEIATAIGRTGARRGPQLPAMLAA